MPESPICRCSVKVFSISHSPVSSSWTKAEIVIRKFASPTNFSWSEKSASILFHTHFQVLTLGVVFRQFPEMAENETVPIGIDGMNLAEWNLRVKEKFPQRNSSSLSSICDI
jgi:hypothetical protein